MTGLNLFGVAWWKWWSNPLVGIHTDHLSSLPFVNITSSVDISDYFKLIQVRSHFELPDLPDSPSTTNPFILAASLATPEQVVKHLGNLAVLTLPSTIIRTRPAEWQEQYAVDSAEEIRDIIERFRSIPHILLSWHQSAPMHIPEDSVLNFTQRSMLGLGVFLKTFFPHLYQRWSLTIGYELLKTIQKLDPFQEAHWNEIMAWMESGFTSLSQEINARFDEAHIELDEESIEEFTPLDVEGLYKANHA